MNVTVDATRCQGHGRCYELSPAVFDADEQGMATVVAGAWTQQRAAAAETAALNCPERAIAIDDAPDGGVA